MRVLKSRTIPLILITRVGSISHIGLQQDHRWDDFQRFDEDDRELFRNLAQGNDPGPREEGDGSRRPLGADMRVIDEVLDRVVTRDFLDPTDAGAVDAVLAEMRRTWGSLPRISGFRARSLPGDYFKLVGGSRYGRRPRPVQPQDRRRELRRRLDEAARSVAGRILEVLGISPPASTSFAECLSWLRRTITLQPPSASCIVK